MKTHKDLDVYKLSKVLVADLYKLTADFLKEKMFDLILQIRRPVISIPSNIVEGSAINHIY